MDVQETEIPGVVLIRPQIFADARGFFLETFDADYGPTLGGARFMQDMHARSSLGVLRGLHYRVARPQGQLVTLLRGAAFDVVADLRRGSPTFGRWIGETLSEDGLRQIYMPPGCAHGYLTLSDWCDLHYKVTESYDGADARSLRWDDPDIAIDWPLDGLEPTISDKDAAAPFLADLDDKQLPRLG